MLYVNTIYPAFMGEVNKFGIGAPCTFVRLAGCNIRCYYKTLGTLCDTPEALVVDSGKKLQEEDILKQCNHYGNNIVCLTGGEPLCQEVKPLLRLLVNHGFNVVIETNGTRDIKPFQMEGVSFVVDFKSTSTNYKRSMLEGNFFSMRHGDFLKFVIYDKRDYEDFVEWYKSYRDLLVQGFHLAVGVFWGSKITYDWLLRKIQADGIPAYLNMQTHKMMCLYDDSKDKDEFGKLFIPKEL